MSNMEGRANSSEVPSYNSVTVGKFGDIKRLLRQLSKRNSFLDLEFICQDGSLSCHKFIIGAQSRYLRQMMLTSGDDLCKIFLPDIPKKNMEIIIKFLYTGRLGITSSVKNIVKDLLENILRIDARIDLPPDSVMNLPSKEENSGDDGSGGAGNGGQSEEQLPSPPSKRSRAGSVNGGEFTSNGFCNGGSDVKYNSVPLSPPHDLDPYVAQEEDDSQDVIILEEPIVIDLSHHDNSQSRAAGRCLEESFGKIAPLPSCHEDNKPQSQTQNLPLTGEPPGSILSDSESDVGSKAKMKSSEIPLAPKIMAKSTGGYFRDKIRSDSPELIARIVDSPNSVQIADESAETPPNNSSESFHQDGSSNEIPGNVDTYVDPHVDTHVVFLSTDQSTSDIPEAPTIMRKSTGGYFEKARQRGQSKSVMESDTNSEVFENVFPIIPLPPPQPVPPRRGMIISRGRWVKKSPGSSVNKTRQQGVRKHHFSPFTITGKVLPSTLATLAEPEGVHECPECPAKYNKRASLDKHIRRSHNKNLQFKCPECPKMLASKAAIKKHLLSHRPENQWPYHCPFCHKRFQAKGDLPKHFNTNKHRNDPRIPARGTQEWFEIFETACHATPSASSSRPHVSDPELEQENAASPAPAIEVEVVDMSDILPEPMEHDEPCAVSDECPDMTDRDPSDETFQTSNDATVNPQTAETFSIETLLASSPAIQEFKSVFVKCEEML